MFSKKYRDVTSCTWAQPIINFFSVNIWQHLSVLMHCCVLDGNIFAVDKHKKAWTPGSFTPLWYMYLLLITLTWNISWKVHQYLTQTAQHVTTYLTIICFPSSCDLWGFNKIPIISIFLFLGPHIVRAQCWNWVKNKKFLHFSDIFDGYSPSDIPAKTHNSWIMCA